MITSEQAVLLLALIGPVLGSLLGIWIRLSGRAICAMMGFAGAAMITISITDMLPEAMQYAGWSGTLSGAIVGAVIVLSLDTFFFRNTNKGNNNIDLTKTAMMTLLAIFVHNLPEGFVMAVNLANGETAKAFTVALAIAIHDIPEGYCTCAPYYYSTGKRWRSFLQSVSTVLPVIIGYYLGRELFSIINSFFLGSTVAMAAGMMLCVSIKELIPTAFRSQRGLLISLFILGGVLVGLL